MGWRDRDYARWTDDERRRFLGPTSVTPGSSRSNGYGPRLGGAAAVSALLVLAMSQLPRSHPIIPGLRIGRSSSVNPGSAPAIIGAARPSVQITGPKTIPVHSFMTFHGSVPIGDEGIVRVLGSLNGGAWQTLTTADGSRGSYLARVAVNTPGTLRIRIVFGDGAQAVETLHVVER